MRIPALLLVTVALLAGCEEANQIASVLNDVEIGVESIDVKSTDPVDISVGLHIREDSKITVITGDSPPETLADKLLGEWIDSEEGVGFAFYADNTFGALFALETSWGEVKFAGTYTLIESNLDIEFNDGDTYQFRVAIRGDRMLMTNLIDGTRNTLSRLR